MSPARTLILTALAMLAFAGNSLLCRAALAGTTIDPASFTTLRLVSGAIALWLLTRGARGPATHDANWRSAATLFVYAAAFSFAYVSLPAASGALILFGAVQATMIGHGLWRGERFRGLQLVGLSLACAGLVGLLLPGISAPPLGSSVLMLGAGIAWGVYSLRGAKGTAPAMTTAGNFWRAAIISLLLYVLFIYGTSLDIADIDRAGVAYALASGAITSGLGYVIWYMALPGLKAISAASAQLSVPLIAALGGVILLGEPTSLRLVVAGAAILGGIGLVIYRAR